MVVLSAAEADLGSIFLNAKEARVIRLNLKELGHLRPPAPIHIYNTKVVGIVKNNKDTNIMCNGNEVFCVT